MPALWVSPSKDARQLENPAPCGTSPAAARSASAGAGVDRRGDGDRHANGIAGASGRALAGRAVDVEVLAVTGDSHRRSTHDRWISEAIDVLTSRANVGGRERN